MKYGKRVADFLATHINAVDEEGNYDFTKAKYNFNPSILNRGGCSYNLFGTGSTEPHGAVGTPSDVILQSEGFKKLEQLKQEGNSLKYRPHQVTLS